MAARLAVEDVAVRYGAVLAVDHVDLAVAPGEVVALLGPSGCGKSSLLAAIAGLVPHAGRVLVDGQDVSRRRPDQRDTGLMFQDGALFPHLDVGDNVGFGLRMRGWAPDRRRARIDEVLELVGLAGLGDRRVDALSGGQAQRVALARAIAPQPRLLLLDEPLSSLDRRLRDRLLAELPEVFAAVDAAVVHVTHDQDEALAVADRVAVMDAGRIVRLDPPGALWDDPRTAFVARFLGWHDVFATTRADADDDHPHLPLDERILATLGHPALVGVDAARVEVDTDLPTTPRATDGATSWTGHVVARHFAGDHVAVDVALDEVETGTGPIVVRATGPIHAMPADDDAVAVRVPDEAWRALAVD
ncbi:ABC transporter ATP-binding protein [Nitriliruptoria bacterium AS10]|nr:ABC transporter ATP-binding protein [Salsipaludibacter albus]